MGSTNKSIADREASKSHHVAERSRPEHSAKGKASHGPEARDARGRHLEREVAKESKK
jgi:hypothetical protein